MYALLLLVASPALFENLEILDERISTISEDAQPVDKRLKLVRCPQVPLIASPVGGALVVRCPEIGWRLRVPVNNRTITSKAAEIVVRKGEMVECISGGPGFAVSTSMIALEDAGIGQPVRVKSPSSPLSITAIVKARGVVSF